MCYASIGTSILTLVINTYYTGNLINAGFLCQMRDLSGILALSLTVFAIVYIVGSLVVNNWLWLIIGGIAGVAIYLGVAKLLHFNELNTIVELIKRKIAK